MKRRDAAWPAVVVHGLVQARAAVAPGRPVTLLSARGAALYAGCGWWRALLGQARQAAAPDAAIDDILDCADDPARALEALRIGQRMLVLDAATPGWLEVAVTVAAEGGMLLATRPASLDLGEPGALRRLPAWLGAG
jgi:hypothetical protein